MSYTLDVDRYGGKHPYVVNGKRFNMRRQYLDSALVHTDGCGNIIKIPLLTRVPCFARPERYIRGTEGAWRNPDLPSGCERCSVFWECCDVVIERIYSDPKIRIALEDWFIRADHLPPNKRFSGGAALSWERFLTAIKTHGGWTNSNDAAEAALNISKSEKRAQAKRDAAKRSRRNARMRNRQTTPVSQQYTQQVDAMRDKLYADLLMLHVQPHAPAWLKRLDADGCARTADVWRAQVVLERRREATTLRAVAEFMIARGDVTGVKPESLRTKVGVIQQRLIKLRKHAPNHYPAGPY